MPVVGDRTLGTRQQLRVVRVRGALRVALRYCKSHRAIQCRRQGSYQGGTNARTSRAEHAATIARPPQSSSFITSRWGQKGLRFFQRAAGEGQRELDLLEAFVDERAPGAGQMALERSERRHEFCECDKPELLDQIVALLQKFRDLPIPMRRFRCHVSYRLVEPPGCDGPQMTSTQKLVVSRFTPPRQISKPAKMLVKWCESCTVPPRATASRMKSFRSKSMDEIVCVAT